MLGNYIIGIIFILLGTGFLLEQLAVINFGSFISLYWPSLLIVIGIIKLFNKKSSRTGNFILILIGGLLQADRLDLISYNIWQLFWPILLIIIGLKFIFFKKSSTKDFTFDHENNFDDSDIVNSFNIFSGMKTLNQSKSFKGGNVTAILGGAEIDLRGAKISDGEAYLEATAMFGGINIFVPTDWKVETTGLPIFGGWENNTLINPDSNAPVLKIKCFAAFGGIEIK